ncbi:hypothetical protein VTI28DRAFT_823 [Corynascus sepedonium]
MLGHAGEYTRKLRCFFVAELDPKSTTIWFMVVYFILIFSEDGGVCGCFWAVSALSSVGVGEVGSRSRYEHSAAP